MGLKNYTPARHEVAIGDNSLSVRGLSLDDISRLVAHHLPDLEALFDLFTANRDVANDDLRQVLVAIVQQAPGFAANTIALAADEPDCADVAQRLPFPVQIDLLSKIGDLTFADVGGVKKGLGDITALLFQARQMKGLTQMAKVR